jgi:hypothetical protein
VPYVAPAIESRTVLAALMTPPVASDSLPPSPLWNRSSKSTKGGSATDAASSEQ